MFSRVGEAQVSDSVLLHLRRMRNVPSGELNHTVYSAPLSLRKNRCVIKLCPIEYISEFTAVNFGGT